jgi:hypothetical protein
MTSKKPVNWRCAGGFQFAIGWVAGPMLALSPCLAFGEIEPALTGLTGRANDATSVFFSRRASRASTGWKSWLRPPSCARSQNIRFCQWMIMIDAQLPPPLAVGGSSVPS